MKLVQDGILNRFFQAAMVSFMRSMKTMIFYGTSMKGIRMAALHGQHNPVVQLVQDGISNRSFQGAMVLFMRSMRTMIFYGISMKDIKMAALHGQRNQAVKLGTVGT